MSKDAMCPLCGRAVDLDDIRKFSSFRCPHCNERLRVVMSGVSQTARWIIIGVLTIALLEGGFGQGVFAFIMWTVAMWFTLIAMGVLNVILSRVFGFTLEPAGRIEFGESEEPEDPGTQ